MTENRRTVTVAICTWNRCEPLRATLQRFTDLRVPADVDWELIVVNNKSTDTTDDVVLSFRDRLPVRLLQEPNPGQSYARNLAIREAKGQYLLWTDDDVLVDADWLAAILRTFEAFDAAFVFGRSEPEWPGRKPTWYAERFRNYFAALDYGDAPFVVTDYDQTFYGLNFAGTIAAHRALTGFRVEFGLKGDVGGVGEDTDFFQRAFTAGMKIVYTPEALVKHVIPEARIHKSYHLRRHWVANKVYFAYMPELYPQFPFLMGIPRFFFGHAASDLAAYGRSLLAGDRSSAFHHELRLVRFARLMIESAKHGFRRSDVPRAMARESASK